MRRTLTTVLSVLGCAFAAATCGGPSEAWDGDDVELCGPDPGVCDGTIGARCITTDDCADGVCCRSDDCGGGTCTFLCAGHADCPAPMLCDGGFCFYSCTTAADCGPGQECHDGPGVCRYD